MRLLAASVHIMIRRVRVCSCHACLSTEDVCVHPSGSHTPCLVEHADWNTLSCTVWITYTGCICSHCN